MNFSQEDPPNSGNEPLVYMDINSNEKFIGRIYIKLFRDVFPLGVENFVNIIAGKTTRVEKKNYGNKYINKNTLRSYKGCKFYKSNFDKYMISGDIYNNDGKNAGTIYNDKPIPPDFGEYFYHHNSIGLVSLVPYLDNNNTDIYYDSTFMITLADNKIINELDDNQIVIGIIYDGLSIIEKINQSLRPFAGKKYPEYVINNCGVIRKSKHRNNKPLKNN